MGKTSRAHTHDVHCMREYRKDPSTVSPLPCTVSPRTAAGCEPPTATPWTPTPTPTTPHPYAPTYASNHGTRGDSGGGETLGSRPGRGRHHRCSGSVAPCRRWWRVVDQPHVPRRRRAAHHATIRRPRRHPFHSQRATDRPYRRRREAARPPGTLRAALAPRGRSRRTLQKKVHEQGGVARSDAHRG